ncbi:MAG: hypothetical protein J3R72DRAFT_484616 [Linnemannia gamsii]|nr:MAG: hypothetical protein J3R72DRAFT_484616 [Linnemannia gamsii]
MIRTTTFMDLPLESGSEAWQDSLSRALKTSGHLVQSLKLRSMGKGDLHSFLECCPSTFPQLTSAGIEGSEDSGEDKDIARFIELCSVGWKKLVFRKTEGAKSQGHFSFRHQAFEALCKHTSTLEIFRIEFRSTLGCDQTNHLLCSAPNLKELYFAWNWEYNYGGWMNASGIVQSDWICHNLEVFACQIGEIPRPDITRYIYDREADSFTYPGSRQRSIELQRQVYSKLAKLTKLRELRLGFVLDTTHLSYGREDAEIYRQYDCLAMTLESGLDLLKGLQNLRVVDLSNMEIYIDGDEEQSWFAEHWPNATILETE